MHFEFDATFWATVALILFFILIAYLKVPAMMAKGLDNRSDKIKSDLDEARQLREEAQQLLAEYQRKRKEAEQEAGEIVAAAKREAEAMTKDAELKTEDYITRRTALAEQKIAQAEGQAIAEVRSTAVDVAVNAAEALIGKKMTTATAGNLFKKSLAEVRTRMN